MKPKLLSTLPGYSARLFAADAFAGVTVALVALPLSIAIAIASGANPATGLTTAIIAGFMISALGGSRVQIGGPTGAFIVVVYGVIARHGYDGLVLATLMAGAILVLAGVLRAGSLVAYVPEPVVNGFTIGIAVIIGSSQIKDFLGLATHGLPADFLPKMATLWNARASLNLAALGIGLAGLALIVALRRLFPRLPGLIVAVAAVSATAAVLHLPVDTIASRFGALPAGLPMPALPQVSTARLAELLPSALVIAFLAAIESLLSAMVADRMIGGSHRPNAEVLAQGWANIASALFGGLPATGAMPLPQQGDQDRKLEDRHDPLGLDDQLTRQDHVEHDAHDERKRCRPQIVSLIICRHEAVGNRDEATALGHGHLAASATRSMSTRRISRVVLSARVCASTLSASGTESTS